MARITIEVSYEVAVRLLHLFVGEKRGSTNGAIPVQIEKTTEAGSSLPPNPIAASWGAFADVPEVAGVPECHRRPPPTRESVAGRQVIRRRVSIRPCRCSKSRSVVTRVAPAP